MDFNIGDVVTRKSHNHDCEFIIAKVNKEKRVAVLKGKCIRLNADAPFDDLEISDKRTSSDLPSLVLPRYEPNTIFGKILHIDGDSSFLKKCMDLYKYYHVPAIGYYFPESDIPQVINELLAKHKPDVLVITGHDAYSNSPFAAQYMNSQSFLNATKNARLFQPSKDAMPIVVGGCQSDFKALIEYSNFASSPGRVNIGALDPAIIAVMISMTAVNEFVDVLRAANQTSGKTRGITGIDTRGVARKIY